MVNFGHSEAMVTYPLEKFGFIFTGRTKVRLGG